MVSDLLLFIWGSSVILRLRGKLPAFAFALNLTTNLEEAYI